MTSVVRSMLIASVADIEQERADRFVLRGWSDGYRIYDNGTPISTIHGGNFDLAARLLRMLREDAEREDAH